jgi:hypothetical protein
MHTKINEAYTILVIISFVIDVNKLELNLNVLDTNINVPPITNTKDQIKRNIRKAIIGLE